MYNSISEELIRAKLAVKLQIPVWMDAKGNLVDEGDAYGCQVTLDTTRPEMCVCADEVDGSTS